MHDTSKHFCEIRAHVQYVCVFFFLYFLIYFFSIFLDFSREAAVLFFTQGRYGRYLRPCVILTFQSVGLDSYLRTHVCHSYPGPIYCVASLQISLSTLFK